jgi:hypothetical protein
MARNTQKKKAQRNKQLWERAATGNRGKWQGRSQKGHEFYLDEQLTKDERESLEESGMPTFTINRITPIIEIMKYFVTANNPRWKAVGATGDDTDVAQIHSDIADYCWYISNGKSVYSQVINDSLTRGIGYFLIDIDKDADLGKGEVKFRNIYPYDVHVDPMSRDFLFRDASFILVKKDITRTQLQNMFPEFKVKIGKAGGNTSTVDYSLIDKTTATAIQPEDVSNLGMAVGVDGEDDDILGYFEVYEKRKFAFYNVFIREEAPPEVVKQVMEEVKTTIEELKAEMMVQLQEKQMQVQQALQSGEIIESRAQLEMQKAQQQMEEALVAKEQELMSQAQESLVRINQMVVSDKEFKIMSENKELSKNIVNAVKFFENKVVLTCSVGDDVFLYERMLPISEYPIVPIPYMYTGTPYPLSAVMPLIGKQQEINKSHQIMLHNANLASNLRWMYEEGSVPEEEWEQYSSAPGALLKYRQGFAPPTPVLPAPINNAFFSIVQEGKSDAEYISGVPSAMMGFTQEQPETYRGLLANDEFGTRRLKSWMSSIVEPCLEHLGRVFQQMSQKHYTIDKVFRIVQPEAGQKEGGEEKEQRINIPIYNDYGKEIGKWLDYNSASFDVRIVAGTTMPINRWALIEEYFRWFQAGLIDDIAMIAETDIRGKKQIIERKSLYAQLQGQVQQMQESLKDREGTIETLERQLVQAGIKMKIGQAETEIRKDVVETEAQQKVVREALKQEFDTAKKDMRRGVETVVDKAQLSAEKAVDKKAENA